MNVSSLATGSLLLASALVIGGCNKDAAKDNATNTAATTHGATSPVGATSAAVATAAATGAAATGAAAAAAAAPPVKLGLKAGEETAASCDTVSADGECGVIVSTDAAGKAKSADAMKKLCKKGTAGTACPTTNLVGYCRMMKDGINYYYSQGGKKYDEASAKAACTKGSGRWME